MENSRLIHLLEILNKKELQELKQFVQCELFHSNKKQYPIVKRLFDTIISPRFKILKPPKKGLSLLLFGKKATTTNNKKLNYTISQSIDLIQKYLVYKNQVNTPHKYHISLLDALQKKQASEICHQLKSSIQRNLSTEKKNSDYFHTAYSIASISLSVKDFRDKSLSNHNEDFKNTISNLDLFFLINQIKYACNSINDAAIMKTTLHESPLLRMIINGLPQTPYFHIPVIQMYWNTYQMLQTREKEHYTMLKFLLFKHHDSLTEYHCFNLFHYLQNYCIQKISTGHHQYFSDFWEISIFRLDNNLLKELTLPFYKNLITTGVMLALQQSPPNFTAVHHFMQNHTNKLSPKLQEEAQTYAQAYLAFYQNNFQTVPQKLIIEQKPLTIYKFQDIYYQIDARRLLVMAFFRLEGEEDNFEKLCNNLSVFLNERKEIIPDLELEKNRQFLIIIKKLFWLPVSRTERREKLEKLKKEVEAAKLISDRTWLLKQIEAKL